MQEKDSYSSNEVAAICAAHLKIFGQSCTSIEESRKYEQFVPKNVRDYINLIHHFQEDFYQRGLNPRQKDSVKNLQMRIKACEAFEEFLKLYEMIEI